MSAYSVDVWNGPTIYNIYLYIYVHLLERNALCIKHSNFWLLTRYAASCLRVKVSIHFWPEIYAGNQFSGRLYFRAWQWMELIKNYATKIRTYKGDSLKLMFRTKCPRLQRVHASVVWRCFNSSSESCASVIVRKSIFDAMEEISARDNVSAITIMAA